jgi:hypothetical protein
MDWDRRGADFPLRAARGDEAFRGDQENFCRPQWLSGLSWLPPLEGNSASKRKFLTTQKTHHPKPAEPSSGRKEASEDSLFLRK